MSLNDILKEFKDKIETLKYKKASEIYNELTDKNNLEINDNVWKYIKNNKNKKFTESMVKFLSSYITKTTLFNISKENFIANILKAAEQKKFKLNELIISEEISTLHSMYIKLENSVKNNYNSLNYNSNIVVKDKEDNNEHNFYSNNVKPSNANFLNSSILKETKNSDNNSTLETNKKNNTKNDKLFYLDSFEESIISSKLEANNNKINDKKNNKECNKKLENINLNKFKKTIKEKIKSSKSKTKKNPNKILFKKISNNINSIDNNILFGPLAKKNNSVSKQKKISILKPTTPRISNNNFFSNKYSFKYINK